MSRKKKDRKNKKHSPRQTALEKFEATQEQKPNVFKRLACATGRGIKTAAAKTKDGVVTGTCAAGRGLKTAGFATGDFFTDTVPSGFNTLVSRIKAGEKLAEECEAMASVLKQAADRAELLETAKELRARAETLETLAKEM